jgi:hypothetical protein
MFQATDTVGDCTFCGSNTTPAFINGTTDPLARLNRVCPSCLADLFAIVDLVPAEKVEETRELLKTANGDVARLQTELHIAHLAAEEAESLLEVTKAQLVSAQDESRSRQEAIASMRGEIAAYERGSLPLKALTTRLHEALDLKPKTTTKTKAKATA